MPLPNGPPTIVTSKIKVSNGLSWGPRGVILVAAQASSGAGELNIVPEKGGDPVRVEMAGFENGGFLSPEFLPDGKNFLFAWWKSPNDGMGLYLSTLENGKITRAPILLLKNPTVAHYAPSNGGRLLYLQDDILYAQPLNIRRGKLEGEPERVVEGVYSYGPAASFSVSRNGGLAWLQGRAELAQLTWFDRKGKVVATAGPPADPRTVRLSPDEKHVLMFSAAGSFAIAEENRNGLVALPRMGSSPLWMPDGAHILYVRKEEGSYSVRTRALVGGAEKELVRLREFDIMRDLSADGKVLLYNVQGKLYSVRLDVSVAKPEMVAETVRGRFAPDGRWIVYSAPGLGSKTEVYVQSFPLKGLRTQLTSAGGEAPIWRADGAEILYRNVQTIYSLPVNLSGGKLHAGKPQPLFDVIVPQNTDSNTVPMAVTRDGSKILFPQGQPLPPTFVMTAWDALLRHP